MEDFHFASIVVSTIRNAPVLMFAAMAGLFAERSGVIDLALEGKILASAFASAAVAFTTQNVWYGVSAGIAVSARIDNVPLDDELYRTLTAAGAPQQSAGDQSSYWRRTK